MRLRNQECKKEECNIFKSKKKNTRVRWENNKDMSKDENEYFLSIKSKEVKSNT